jgi:hypothetical protein
VCEAAVDVALLRTCVHSLEKMRQRFGRSLRRVMAKQDGQESLKTREQVTVNCLLSSCMCAPTLT